ncbi:hypothetical protein SISSUDRAFT_629660 [Sistotremastrum suecicum HHB10207 ss-3]|uniref:PH domain-containing protein n=1 Tax=Sistotremastrum suecicum HHB10207 ss-3 TaxID=1314776 RepID=A0A166EGP2_9AGAM|nr:hypothetical protein SISSUDRAFT_629660 [Sistotremastrum suecicum HHB10207 ss-3]
MVPIKALTTAQKAKFEQHLRRFKRLGLVLCLFLFLGAVVSDYYDVSVVGDRVNECVSMAVLNTLALFGLCYMLRYENELSLYVAVALPSGAIRLRAIRRGLAKQQKRALFIVLLLAVSVLIGAHHDIGVFKFAISVSMVYIASRASYGSSMVMKWVAAKVIVLSTIGAFAISPLMKLIFLSPKEDAPVPRTVDIFYNEMFRPAIWAILPGVLVTMALRLDYTIWASNNPELEQSNIQSKLKVINVPKRRYIPAIHRGVLVPSSSRLGFAYPKTYFKTALSGALFAQTLSVIAVTILIGHGSEEYLDPVGALASVPCILLGFFLQAWRRGENRTVWNYRESWKVEVVIVEEKPETAEEKSVSPTSPSPTLSTSPAGLEGSTTSTPVLQFESSGASQVEELAKCILDCHGQPISELGPLYNFDKLFVSQPPVVRKFSVYLFQEAILCVTECGQSSSPSSGTEPNCRTCGRKGTLEVKGRIYIRHIKSVSDTSTSDELSLSIHPEAPSAGPFRLLFDDEASLKAWQCAIQDLIGRYQLPPLPLNFDQSESSL